MEFIPKPVLTMDIVNYSLMSNTEQYQAFRNLIEMLAQAIPREHNKPGRRIWSPAGDGGSLTFWDDINAALHTAVNLGKLINAHNKDLPPEHHMRLRMGLHSGSVIKEVDLDERENVWGNGINISARVMSMARPGQILASREYCVQADLLSRPKEEVNYIGKWWAKHNKTLDLYNIYIDGAGLPPSEVDEWYGPFHYPLQQAMETYAAMIEDERTTGPAFRVAVLCKRLLDLEPSNVAVQQVLESISESRFDSAPGAKNLYDSFFSQLSPSALVYFFHNSQFKAVPKGKVIAREGEPASTMMMVVSGEIIPYIRGTRLKNQRDNSEVVLREGAIIGEMGLFSPGGVRTATMEASKNAIVLTLDYRYLRTLEGNPNTPENRIRLEIQKRIWKYYCQRTVSNAINLHPLLRLLRSDQRNRLLDIGNYEFLPAEYGQPFSLTVEDMWEYVTVIVGGGLVVYTKKDNQPFEYKAEESIDLLGILRFGVQDCPFSEIVAQPDTHLIRFPFNLFRDFANDSDSVLFAEECDKYSGREKRRLKLM
jgi:CRP-like cAMP-binding protein